MPNTIELKACFGEPRLQAMNFLNEVTLQFPDAISFAPGRPHDCLVNVARHLDDLAAYVAECARLSGRMETEHQDRLGQYTRTRGIIAQEIATHLAADEGIDADPDSIIVTVGAQEAMAIVLAGLFDPPHDILLASDPTYVGITGLARVLGIRVVSVPSTDTGLDAQLLESVIRTASGDGYVRAFYDIPDFNNPLGTSLSYDARIRVLEVCRRYGVLFIEDNPYGMFAYDGDRLPTLKALDAHGSVLYIGSLSKVLCPGLRLGYLVADQRTRPDGKPLAAAFSVVKSLLTVNTSPILQAIAAGALLRAGGSLEPIVAPKRAQYRQQRDAMLAALAATQSRTGANVSWNTPAGGFFLTLSLPFAFGPAELNDCAAHYGVIVSPMQTFCLGVDRTRDVRLSFSSAGCEEIKEGIERLIAFVCDRDSARIGVAERRVADA